MKTRRSTRLQEKDIDAVGQTPKRQTQKTVSKNKATSESDVVYEEGVDDLENEKLQKSPQHKQEDNLTYKNLPQEITQITCKRQHLFSIIRERKSEWKGNAVKSQDECKNIGSEVRNKTDGIQKDETLSLGAPPTPAIETEIVTANNANSIGNAVSRFKLDLSKYKNFNSSNSFLKKNSLLQTAHALKNNFPFKDHLKQKRVSKKEDNSSVDVFGLNEAILTDDKKTNSTEMCTDINQGRNYFEISDSGVKSVHNKEEFVNKLMKKSVLPDDLERMEKCPKFYENRFVKNRQKKQKAEETAGPNWYNLPKTELTDDVKRDLQIIKMRNALDGKHHYKRNDTNKFPKYFQMGTVVEGSHEYYSARVSKKNRKRTMVDELLADAAYRKKNKKKLIEMNKKKSAGGKEYYKHKKNKRKPTWART